MSNEIEARECQTCRSIGLVLAAMIVGLISYYVEKTYPIWVAVVAFLVLLAVSMWLVNKFCGTADQAEGAPAKAEPARKVEPTLAEPVLTTPKPVAAEPEAVEPEVVAVVEPVVEVIEATPEVTIEDGDFDKDGVVEGDDEGERPEMLATAREGKADDLKKIKGVGPKLEKTLNSLGFYHFDQLASWSADEIAWVDANLEGFKGRVTRDGWVKQAKTLAGGGNTAFSKKVDKGDVY